MTKPPRVIYLQLFDEDGQEREFDEITWAENEIFDGDVKYILAEESQ